MKQHVYKVLPVKDRNDRAEGQKGSKWQSGPSSSLVERDQYKARHRAGYEAKEQSRQNDAWVQPAEIHAEQRRQPNIAVAHPATAEHVDEPHHGRCNHGTEKHHPDALGFVENQSGDRQRDPAEDHADIGDLARKALGVEVDPGQRDERGTQDAVSGKFSAGAELNGEQDEYSGRSQLDDDRLDSDGRAALSALAAQRHPAHDRHEVERSEPQTALTATAGRCHHRAALRYAFDNHSQKRTDQQTGDDYYEDQQREAHKYLWPTLARAGG
jgi:hypothetical protein